MKKMVNLKIEFCGVEFPNPLILPSGIAQEIPQDHRRAIEAGAGGITTKSLTLRPRPGYPFPRVIRYSAGILNAVGLRNPGLSEGKKLLERFLAESSVPVIVSLFATNPRDFQLLTKEIAKLHPSFIELNLSCPNVEDEYGQPLALCPDSAAQMVKAAKREAGGVPILAKLSPNVSAIAEVAKACEEAGASGIVAINTLGPGMVIDIKTKKPVLGNKKGGVSGPGIKPIAIRCVYEIYEAVKIPIIGMGGVETWQDVVEMMMAGATLVGVGSAVYLHGYSIYEEIKKGLLKYLKEKGLANLKKIVGLAH